MNENLILYGTTAGFKEHDGMIEQVALGQVTKWGIRPSSMLGVGFDRRLIKEIAGKSGKSLEEYMSFYEGRHTRIEFAPENTQCGVAVDGEKGARILLSISGSLDRPRENRNFWRKKLKNFEANADLTAKLRASEDGELLEVPYKGKMLISGPDYALQGFKEFLLEELQCQVYHFSFVSKVQYLSFLER